MLITLRGSELRVKTDIWATHQKESGTIVISLQSWYKMIFLCVDQNFLTYSKQSQETAITYVKHDDFSKAFSFASF